jgi:hypothetical protein
LPHKSLKFHDKDFIPHDNNEHCCKRTCTKLLEHGRNTLSSFERLGSINNFDLRLMSNNNTLMALKPNGRMGFGLVAPLNKFHFRGLVRIEDSIGVTNSPLMILNGRSNNSTIELRTNDTSRTIFGYDESSKTFTINTLGPVTSSFAINKLTKEISIGTDQINDDVVNIWSNTNVDGDLNMMVAGGRGDINLLSPEQNLSFATPGRNDHAAMMYMTGSKTSFKRMVLSHSLTFSNWGLQYDDALDQFDFLGNGNSKLAVNLTNGRIGINQPSPDYSLDVTGHARITGNVGIGAPPNGNTLQLGGSAGGAIGIGSVEKMEDGGAFILTTNSTLLPSSDNTRTLGSAANRWNAVWATDGTINTSDAREKTNIRDLVYGLNEILQLHPVSFHWKNNMSEGNKLGLLAQEIQKVLPEVVRDYDYITDEKTGQATKVKTERLGVAYSDIIPVLIHAIQEQQAQIENLKTLIQNSSGEEHNNMGSSTTGFSLSQNRPNPVRELTTIHYTSSDKNMQLVIFDARGMMMQQHLLRDASGSVQVDCSNLADGTYTYVLKAGEKTILSKKMVVIN